MLSAAVVILANLILLGVNTVTTSPALISIMPIDARPQ